MKHKRSYGWVRQLPDLRDHKFALAASPIILPPGVDMSGSLFMPLIWDQGQLGSCTAHAIAAAYEFERLRQGLSALSPSGTPSRLFIYNNERVIEGTTSYDAGANLRDGIKAIATQGVCDESLWIYDESRFNVSPPSAVYEAATSDLALQYAAINQDLVSLKSCLAAGYPFVFGFSVYDSFESAAVAATGIVPLPDVSTEELLGGHAVMACGYNDAKQVFIVRNSWGSEWGNNGYFTLPYSYMTSGDLASDFWQVSKVS
jgi:C1A family cysteine protease